MRKEKNWTEPTELRLIFALYFVYQRYSQRLESWTLYFLQPPYLHRYADTVAVKGVLLYDCFDFVDGTIARTCGPVLNKRVVYRLYTRLHGMKSQSVVLPNGLIISLEGQWEGWRHESVLCFMNRVYLINSSGWHGLIINLCFYMETDQRNHKSYEVRYDQQLNSFFGQMKTC